MGVSLIETQHWCLVLEGCITEQTLTYVGCKPDTCVSKGSDFIFTEDVDVFLLFTMLSDVHQ